MPRTRTKKKATIEYLDENTSIDRENYLYYVGIDPSYSSTGFVVLDQESNTPLVAVTIRAGNPKDPFIKRMQRLLDRISELMIHLDRENTLVCMEGAAFASEFGAFKLGKLSGVLEYYLGSNNIPYCLVAPTYVKKVATSNGAATKDQVIAGVRYRWGYKNSNNDINDAYVMAQIARGALPIPKEKPKSKKATRSKE